MRANAEGECRKAAEKACASLESQHRMEKRWPALWKAFCEAQKLPAEQRNDFLDREAERIVAGENN